MGDSREPRWVSWQPLRSGLAERVRAATGWVLRQAGFRGLFLALLGIFDLFYGSYLVTGSPVQYPLLFPERAWGVIWLAVGALLIRGSFMARDRWYFALATALKVAWALEFFWLEYQHDTYQWTRGSYFLALALIIVLVSAWPEPRRLP